MNRSWLRALVAAALLSAWMVLLFVGWSAGGWTHLILLAALLATPWRALVSGSYLR